LFCFIYFLFGEYLTHTPIPFWTRIKHWNNSRWQKAKQLQLGKGWTWCSILYSLAFSAWILISFPRALTKQRSKDMNSLIAFFLWFCLVKIIEVEFFHYKCLCLYDSLFEEGGDWERKNRLKVYEGLYCLSTRNFKKAADLFLDSISTFTTYELFPYDTFIFYTVLTSIISLDRVSLKQKVFKVMIWSSVVQFSCWLCLSVSNFNWIWQVVDAPEILTVIGKIPHLSEFLNSLYDCQYKSFFSAFGK